ncbi:MAG TPA: UDP-glucuronic acid decarboxylase family protein [Nitrospiria bacterium]
METCLVTGGAGFIGSHLCEKLLGKGYHVLCMDNFITGRKENIQPLFSNPHFKFLHHDVIQSIELKEEVHYIFHFASPASPVHYQWYPLETALVNSTGTKNLLDVTLGGPTKFLLASTSEVYGDPLVHPQKESYWGNVNTVGPRSCYDESKRLAETLTTIYHQEFGCDVAIVRIFNTYGPRMKKDDGRVVSNFICQAIRNLPLTVYGDGKQTRSLCYVDDLIEGITHVMFSKTTSGEVFNLGNPHEVTIGELAIVIKGLTRSKSEISYHPLPQDDPKQRNPDIQKIGDQLGWAPKISLEKGLSQTIDWFQKNQGKS